MTSNACNNGIRNWAIVFGGFRQTNGRPSGSFNLWRKIHNAIAAPGVRTEFRAWNDDVDQLADLVFYASSDEFEPTVNVAAFSWGGAAAARFAARLADRGIEIDRMVLSDPVYRHCYWAGNWRAFVPYSKIKIPANVRRVDWFRQTVNLPAGHTPVAVDPKQTVVGPPVELSRRHVWMDDAAEYHLRAVAAAAGALA